MERNLLMNRITEHLDEFARQNKIDRLAALIGGEAVIQHGVPRTTLDTDILFHYNANNALQELSDFLKHKLGNEFEVKSYKKDSEDPLKHDLITIEDKKGDSVTRLDILLVTYKWEVEGLREMKPVHEGELKALPIPYLVTMKLMSGSVQDNIDITNLFLIMNESEKQKTRELAHLIHRDKKLNKIIEEMKAEQPEQKPAQNFKQTEEVKHSRHRHF